MAQDLGIFVSKKIWTGMAVSFVINNTFGFAWSFG